MTTGKTIALTRLDFVGKVMSLLFNLLPRFEITFLIKEQVSLNFMSTVTICRDFGAQENKVGHCFHCFPIYLPWSDGSDAMTLVFWMLSFKPAFSLSSFTSIKRLLSCSSISSILMVSSAYLRFLIFLPVILIPACASFRPNIYMMSSSCKLDKMTIFSLEVLLSQFGTSPLFHVCY